MFDFLGYIGSGCLTLDEAPLLFVASQLGLGPPL